MKKYLFVLAVSGILGISSEVWADTAKKNAVDDNYVASLRKCAPAVYENKLNIIGREVIVRQEIKGIEAGFCHLIIDRGAERKTDCLIPPEKMKLLADSFQNPKNDNDAFFDDNNYCQDLPTDKVSSFLDANGVAYNCDTALNVRMVSVEECSKCSNRKVIEDRDIKLADKPLGCCVLK